MSFEEGNACLLDLKALHNVFGKQTQNVVKDSYCFFIRKPHVEHLIV